jgi:hypothetical protein
LPVHLRSRERDHSLLQERGRNGGLTRDFMNLRRD